MGPSGFNAELMAFRWRLVAVGGSWWSVAVGGWRSLGAVFNKKNAGQP